MSKGVRAILLFVVVGVYVLSMAQIALAASEGGFNYTIVSGTRARVLSYYGASPNVVVPPTLGGLPVYEIYANAFSNNTTVTSVALPDSVTSVGSAAFVGMTALTSIDFGAGLQRLDTSAVRGCTSLTRVVLPATLTTTLGSVFRSCTSLTAAYFLGDAPTNLDASIFQSTAPGFTVYVLPGKSGWGSVPGAWYTYPTAYLVYKTVRVATNTGATITPALPQNVIPGGSITFTITKGPGVKSYNVTVDGTSVGQVGTYTFTNVTTNHSIGTALLSNVPASSPWSLVLGGLAAVGVVILVVRTRRASSSLSS